MILARTSVYCGSFSESRPFGALESTEDALTSLDPDTREESFMLLLPDVRIIYTDGDGDHHTRTIWYQDAELAAPFVSWVLASGLKFVGGPPVRADQRAN